MPRAQGERPANRGARAVRQGRGAPGRRPPSRRPEMSQTVPRKELVP
ncbi:hypothetical protein YWIDRAFT_04234 [Streptomyces sp. SceaMP-e96]|nr:hypothetical protein YWIDRAFT_04234 [Streptomyces sp. SceaMP-e96]